MGGGYVPFVLTRALLKKLLLASERYFALNRDFEIEHSRVHWLGFENDA